MTMIETSDKQTPKIGQGLAGPGRPAGQPNRSTKALKDAILLGAVMADAKMRKAAGDPNAPDVEGSLEGYCAWLAEHEPSSFAALLGRVLPIQIKSQGAPLDPAQSAGVNELGQALAFALRLGAVQKPEPKTINHNPTERNNGNERKI